MYKVTLIIISISLLLLSGCTLVSPSRNFSQTFADGSSVTCARGEGKLEVDSSFATALAEKYFEQLALQRQLVAKAKKKADDEAKKVKKSPAYIAAANNSLISLPGLLPGQAIPFASKTEFVSFNKTVSDKEFNELSLKNQNLIIDTFLDESDQEVFHKSSAIVSYFENGGFQNIMGTGESESRSQMVREIMKDCSEFLDILSNDSTI